VSLRESGWARADPVVFRQGKSCQAISPSCAFPGLFEPGQIAPAASPMADGARFQPAQRAKWVRAWSSAFRGAARRPARRPQHVSSRPQGGQRGSKNQWKPGNAMPTWSYRPAVQGLAWDDFDRIDEAIEVLAEPPARSAVPRSETC